MAWNITLTEVGVKTCALRLAYLKTIPAIFKIIELILAITLIGIVTYYYNEDEGHSVPGALLFLLIIVTFFICSFCLFVSEWIVWSTVNSNSKSMFEIIFFVVSFILLFSSAINLFANVVEHSDASVYLAYLICSILQFLLMGLYVTDLVISLCLQSCRKTAPKEESDLNS